MTVAEGWAPADATERRLSRSRLHAYVRATSSRAGAKACMVEPVAGVVKINVDGTTGRGHVSGLKRCKSMWSCPVCAPSMRAARAAETTALVERAQAIGHTVVMPSYTFPHQAGEPLAETLGYLREAFRLMWSGRWADGFRTRYGITGQVRAMEVTYGVNGWHPHAHQLLFCDLPQADIDAALVPMWLALYRRWCDCVMAVCGRKPSSRNGLQVEMVHDAQAVGEYVADAGGWSVGSEVCCQPVKVARGGESVTAFNLLGAAAMWGDADAGRLWDEYERATKGVHAIQASPGLYVLYEVAQVDDDEAAAPAATNVVATVEVDPMDWLLLAEYQITDRYVMAVEEWAATASGSPPTARAMLLEVLAERRAESLVDR